MQSEGQMNENKNKVDDDDMYTSLIICKTFDIWLWHLDHRTS
jgi:hypothetical protein